MQAALLIHGAGGGAWEWRIWQQVFEAAGMTVVAVPSRITIHNDLSHADLVVRSLREVTIERLAALAEGRDRPWSSAADCVRGWCHSRSAREGS